MLSDVNIVLPLQRDQEAAPRTQQDALDRSLGNVQDVVDKLATEIDDVDSAANQHLDNAQMADGNVKVLAGNVSSSEALLNSLITDLAGRNHEIAETKRTGKLVACSDADTFIDCVICDQWRTYLHVLRRCVISVTRQRRRSAVLTIGWMCWIIEWD